MLSLLRTALFIVFLIVPAAGQWMPSGSHGVFGPLESWGDSLTAGNQDGSGTTYPNVLATLYAPNITVANQGVGGQTSSQILTRFQAVPSTWGYGTLIWSGENNFNSGAQVQADIATMVSDLTTPNYLVFALLNGEGSGIGTGNYTTITTLNAAFGATYGVQYLDVRSQLAAAYNPANAIDVIDHTNDVSPPFTLRAATASGTISAINSSDTAFTTSAANLSPNFIITVGTEYIYILSATGTSVTNCTRGYAGSTAASHSNGAAYVGTDPTHPNAAGYTLVAGYVYRKIQSFGGWRQ